jgi:hypothetical protein
MVIAGEAAISILRRLVPTVPLACLLLAGVAPSAVPAAPDGTPQLVRRAIADYGTEHRGELAFVRHLTFALKVGPVTHDVNNEVAVLMRDGDYVKVHYNDQSTNGKPDAATQVKHDEDKANADLSAGHGFFKRPIDPHFSDDYRFEAVSCDGCSSGEDAFAFTSSVHDVQHGHGTVVIDSASAHVVRVEYTLEQPPEHASSASGVETYGEPMPGLWTCVRVAETYHGRLGLIGGAATMTYTLDRFRRFSQLASGLAALSEGSL